MKVHCSKGKVLDSDSCLTALDQIRGLSYNVQVWFEPLMTTETNLAEIDPRSAFDVVMDGLYQQACFIHSLYKLFIVSCTLRGRIYRELKVQIEGLS